MFSAGQSKQTCPLPQTTKTSHGGAQVLQDTHTHAHICAGRDTHNRPVRTHMAEGCTLGPVVRCVPLPPCLASLRRRWLGGVARALGPAGRLVSRAAVFAHWLGAVRQRLLRHRHRPRGTGCAVVARAVQSQTRAECCPAFVQSDHRMVRLVWGAPPPPLPRHPVRNPSPAHPCVAARGSLAEGGGGGGAWHKALVLVWWRRPLASRPGLVSWRSTKAAALAHRFCFSVGGGSWHQHI